MLRSDWDKYPAQNTLLLVTDILTEDKKIFAKWLATLAFHSIPVRSPEGYHPAAL